MTEASLQGRIDGAELENKIEESFLSEETEFRAEMELVIKMADPDLSGKAKELLREIEETKKKPLSNKAKWVKLARRATYLFALFWVGYVGEVEAKSKENIYESKSVNQCSTVGLPFNQVYNPDAGVGELGYVYKLDPNYHMLAGNVKDVAGYYQGDPDEWGLTLFYRIQTDCE